MSCRRIENHGCAQGCGAIIVMVLLIIFWPVLLEFVEFIFLLILLAIGDIVGALMNAFHSLF
jgi:hypothetical protein